MTEKTTGVRDTNATIKWQEKQQVREILTYQSNYRKTTSPRDVSHIWPCNSQDLIVNSLIAISSPTNAITCGSYITFCFSITMWTGLYRSCGTVNYICKVNYSLWSGSRSKLWKICFEFSSLQSSFSLKYITCINHRLKERKSSLSRCTLQYTS